MLKHQPCCRAVLAETQNKKIIHKNPVSVPFPLKSQGWGSRGLPSPPTLQDGWATHGGPNRCDGLVWGLLAFLLVLPSHPIPSLEGQGVPSTHQLCTGIGIPVVPGCSGGERRLHLVRGRLKGADRRCHVKKNSWRGMIR